VSWLSNILGGRSKAVQAERVITPSIGGYEQYEPLKDFAFKRMSGETAGFGLDDDLTLLRENFFLQFSRRD